MTALLAIASAADGATSKTPTTTSPDQRAGMSHVKAAPAFPVPASAHVPGRSSASTTSTTPGAATTPSGVVSKTPGAVSTTPATTTPSGAQAQTTPPAGGTAAQGGIPVPQTNGATRAGLAGAHRHSPGKLSTAALVGAVLAGLLILLCAIWALVRWLAIEPRWTRSLSYSLEEAGFRASATWAELLDWARIGR